MYRGGSQRDIQWCLIRHDGPFPGVINAEQRGEINDASAGLRHSPSLTIYCHTTGSQEKLSRRDDRTFTELMKLARFIQTGMGQLLEDFGEAALEIAPELKGEDSRALEDHAREMLEFITEDLLTPQTARESARKALGKAGSPASMAGNRHGSGRHGQGLSMLQTIQELRALRARVMKAWSDSQQGLSTDDFAELLRFNEAIDQLIVSSVASYTALKEQEAHLFEAMLRASPDPSAIFDPDGKILFLNTPMADMANTTALGAVGKTPLQLALGFAMELHDAIAATVTTGQFQRRELHYPAPSGQEVYFDCTACTGFR